MEGFQTRFKEPLLWSLWSCCGSGPVLIIYIFGSWSSGGPLRRSFMNAIRPQQLVIYEAFSPKLQPATRTRQPLILGLRPPQFRARRIICFYLHAPLPSRRRDTLEHLSPFSILLPAPCSLIHCFMRHHLLPLISIRIPFLKRSGLTSANRLQAIRFVFYTSCKLPTHNV